MLPERMARAFAARGWSSFLIVVALAAAVLGPTRARAQALSSHQPVRGFVAASLGSLMPTSTMSSAYDQRVPCCRTSITFEYSKPAQFAVDVTAGIVFADRITAGLSYAYSSAQVAAQATRQFEVFPPYSPSTSMDQWRSGALARAEAAAHISAGLLLGSRSWELSVAGGPSYVTASYEVLIVRYGRTETETWTRSNWGFHVAAGATYYLSQAIGVGATVRYSRATLTFPNYGERLVEDRYATATSFKTTAGGTEILAGLRWRF
jgi:hypothetical protein